MLSVKEYLVKLKEKAPLVNEERIVKAFEYGKAAHDGQFRRDGSEYFTHPIEVSLILSEFLPDEDSLVAALLHDTVEDTYVTSEDVKEHFGEDVMHLVDGVTKLSSVTFESKQQRQAESIRKMLIAMSYDFRVILIKLADRMHNMRTLMFMPEHRQIGISEETLNIYAPIAHRLGIFKIKWELEDLCLKYLDPESYQDLVDKVNKKLFERQQVINEYIAQLKQAMDEVGIECEIMGRPKNFYSIYRKMKYQHKEFDEIYDLTAIRIIVEEESNLYAVLGIVHTLWNFIPGRFKDYVSTPKNNIYRSLHTTLMGKNEPFEIQIRTYEMHREAEYGIAAHWRYKEGTLKQQSDFDEKIKWFRQMMDIQGDIKDAGEFIDAVQNDILNSEVYVFTPEAEVVDLPDGSTPIDFAYRIHSEVGNRAVGAKVNGKSVPLSYRLQNGQVVEIRTMKSSQGPSRDWLKFVKTNQAKHKIKQFFKRERRDENIQKGRDMIVYELKRQGFNPKEVLTEQFMHSILTRLSLKNIDDLYNAIGYGGILTSQVTPRVREKVAREKAQQDSEVAKLGMLNQVVDIPKPKIVNYKTQRKGGVIVKGMEGMATRFAGCCTPVPGDDIIGFVTRGRGVTVHRADCNNFEKKGDFAARIIEAEWAENEDGGYIAGIQIVAYNRKGLISEITSIVANLDIDLRGVNAKVVDDQTVVINISVEISNKNEMDSLVIKIKGVPDIVRVTRTSGS